MADDKILIPQVYKRFNDKLYCTVGISKPIEMSDYVEYKGNKITFNIATCGVFQRINGYYSEKLHPYVCVWYDKHTGNYYHLKRVSNNELILYRALFDDNDLGLYLENKKKFLSLMKEYNEKEEIK